jgi:hypothetical protein
LDLRYQDRMSVNQIHPQAEFPSVPRPATASPLTRFAPTAATVSDYTVDQWVEQELRRGRSRMRAGLAMLAFLAGLAIPIVLLLK